VSAAGRCSGSRRSWLPAPLSVGTDLGNFSKAGDDVFYSEARGAGSLGYLAGPHARRIAT
jgi:hypothetical protein